MEASGVETSENKWRRKWVDDLSSLVDVGRKAEAELGLELYQSRLNPHSY